MPPNDLAEASVSHALSIVFIFCSLLFGLFGILRISLRSKRDVRWKGWRARVGCAVMFCGKGNSRKNVGAPQCHAPTDFVHLTANPAKLQEYRAKARGLALSGGDSVTRT